MKSFSSLLCCLLLAVSAAGCWVPELPDDTLFACDTAADCAEEGVVCVPRTGLRGYCCKATLEVCNGLDDDCDGQKDDLADSPCYGGPTGTQGKGTCKAGKPSCNAKGEVVCTGEVRPGTEVCNGLDDNCDGQTDEGFDLLTDMANCGQCGNPCGTGFACIAGSCQKRTELDCNNGADDDDDGKTDCADTDCNSQSCGPNCICIGGTRGEGVCSNGADDEPDGTTDCIDSDCDGKECNATVGGCTCKNLSKSESACGDGEDNDSDILTDCADSTDCDTKACGTGCVCSGNKAKETVCNDGGGSSGDNDGDSLTDCADADCVGLECGLGGCTCVLNRKTETNCGDGQDNDNDGQPDCADYDCAYKTLGTTGVRCQGYKKVEFNCNDGADNDGDGKTDCADSDCDGVIKSTNVICSVNNTPIRTDETNCTDNIDNDGDGNRDCNGGKPSPNCSVSGGRCGFGCVLTATCSNTKREIVCDDDFDNDGDGNKDCLDTDCSSTTGNSCRKTNGTAGTCQLNKTCG